MQTPMRGQAAERRFGGPTLSAALDLVLGRRCVGCERPGVALCAVCRPLTAPGRVWARGLWVHCAGPYCGALRTAIVHYKDRERRDLAPPLSRLLGNALDSLFAQPAVRAGPGDTAVLLVPVPSTRRAVARRGEDHLVRLLLPLAAARFLSMSRLLTVSTRVRDSSGLDAAARARNIAAAMSARRLPGSASPARIVLVDDVMTTGSTLREARRALSAAGYQVVGAAVIAVTPRGVLGSSREAV